MMNLTPRAGLILLGIASLAPSMPAQENPFPTSGWLATSNERIRYLPTQATHRVRIETTAEGRYIVHVDGTELAEERVVDREGRLCILSEDGRLLAEVDQAGDGRLILPAGAILTLPAIQHKRAVIGVTVGAVSEALAVQLGLDAERAFLVTEVTEGHAADEAGVKKFDIVTHVDGQPAAGGEVLKACLKRLKAGDAVTLKVCRGNQVHEFRVPVREEAVQDGAWRTPWFDRLTMARPITRAWPTAANRLSGGLKAGERLSVNDGTIYFDPAAPRTGRFPFTREAADGPQAGDPSDDAPADLKEIDARLRRLEELLERLVQEKHDR